MKNTAKDDIFFSRNAFSLSININTVTNYDFSFYLNV